jgi:D-alanyl-D-alanine carboxypeptidase
MRRIYFAFLRCRIAPVVLAAAALAAASATAAAQLPAATTAKIDEIAARALADTRAPSVSVAIVQGGKIAYE